MLRPEQKSRVRGLGITHSDLLVINKTDLGPLIGTSVEVIDHHARKSAGSIVCLLQTEDEELLDVVIGFHERAGDLHAEPAPHAHG